VPATQTSIHLNLCNLLVMPSMRVSRAAWGALGGIFSDGAISSLTGGRAKEARSISDLCLAGRGRGSVV
jgi:hypothetical protein